MKIGELAQVGQCTVETVRYYEKEGLLPAPARTAGNFRQYGPIHVERLRFIRNCRALDMSHGEIRILLDLADQPSHGCAAINAVFDQHIAHVDERIRELMQQIMDAAEYVSSASEELTASAEQSAEVSGHTMS